MNCGELRLEAVKLDATPPDVISPRSALFATGPKRLPALSNASPRNAELVGIDDLTPDGDTFVICAMFCDT